MQAIPIVTVRVSDVPEALAFYRDRLGLRCIHVDGTFHEFDTGGARLAIDASGRRSGPKGPDECPVEIHLQVDAIDAARHALEEHGVRFAGPTERHDFGSFARCYDPDGNPLLLYEPGNCPLKAAREGSMDAVTVPVTKS